MEKQRKNQSAYTAHQIDKLRRLYSQIGEPLPVDVIIDLHRHLGGALELYENEQKAKCGKKRRQILN